MGFLDGIGDGLEGLYEDGRKQLGTVVDNEAHAVGYGLNLVGLHDAAQAVDNWGDSVADSLGAQIGEKQLGESDDPKDLVHGDAKALSDFSHTVTWAQGQAKQAVDAYNTAKKSHEQARNAYNASVTSYNAALKSWSEAAKASPNPGPGPTDPGDFHDEAGNAQLAHAQDLLRGARAGRDQAADSAAKAIRAATGKAPREPSFSQRMVLDSVDLAEGGMVGYEHQAASM